MDRKDALSALLSVNHKRQDDKKVCTPLRAEGPLATHEAALRLRLTAHLRSEELRDQQGLGLELGHSSRYAMLSIRSRLHNQEV